MGILNITPDSFSDASHCLDPDLAVKRALRMIEEGADIIDIGGESTRPGACPVDAEEEKRRVLPVLAALAGHIDCPLSVDTTKSEVADAALDAGAEIVNDVSGFNADPLMADLVARSRAGVVVMHTRGTPATMQHDTTYDDLISYIASGLRNSCDRAAAAGIQRECIALDPGIGFGKNQQGNLEILRRLREFTGLRQPLLIGTSRKSFIGRTLDRETGERLHGTSATVALAVANGASILRVHDVRAMRDVADMAHAICGTRDQ